MRVGALVMVAARVGHGVLDGRRVWVGRGVDVNDGDGENEGVAGAAAGSCASVGAAVGGSVAADAVGVAAGAGLWPQAAAVQARIRQKGIRKMFWLGMLSS